MDQKLTREELSKKLQAKLKGKTDNRKTLTMHKRDLEKKDIPEVLIIEILEYIRVYNSVPFSDDVLKTFKGLPNREIDDIIEKLWKNAPQ